MGGDAGLCRCLMAAPSPEGAAWSTQEALWGPDASVARCPQGGRAEVGAAAGSAWLILERGSREEERPGCCGREGCSSCPAHLAGETRSPAGRPPGGTQRCGEQRPGWAERWRKETRAGALAQGAGNGRARAGPGRARVRLSWHLQEGLPGAAVPVPAWAGRAGTQPAALPLPGQPCENLSQLQTHAATAPSQPRGQQAGACRSGREHPSVPNAAGDARVPFGDGGEVLVEPCRAWQLGEDLAWYRRGSKYLGQGALRPGRAGLCAWARRAPMLSGRDFPAL